MSTRSSTKHFFTEQQMNKQIRTNTWTKTVAMASITLGLMTPVLTGCSSGTNNTAVYQLQGAVTLVHDPTIIRQGSTYYVLSTDPGLTNGQVGYLPILTSTDQINWTRSGQVFNTLPAWASAYNNVLWAPDVSFFNGVYHVYYTVSSFGTNNSAIGLATAPSMAGPWIDSGGPILTSSAANTSYNAIDSNILVDYGSGTTVQHVWMTYGSFFGGIFQREINPLTGQLSATNIAVVQLATRPGVTGNPVEGASLVQKNGFYYLFASFGSCCNANYTTDNYEIVVGRSSSPNGPFVDQSGTSMLSGGGTVLLATGGEFTAPGGEFVYTDATNGDLITFHALSDNQNGLDYLFVNQITWPNNWPLIGTTP
jgi:arabinan endo-1,5-alpha-L-arabinosidase